MLMPISEAPPPAGGRQTPGREGGWWTAWRAAEVYCSTCRHTCWDRPAVMRYRKSLDADGSQSRLSPDCPARGWLVWWECPCCGDADFTRTVDDAQVAAWSGRLGPWYRG